jgi:lactoylglutathione lyase
MRVTSSFPIISTPDLDRTLSFYRDVLGGSVIYSFPPDGPPAFVAMDLGSSQLGLAHDRSVDLTATQRTALWLYTDDCDALVEAVRHAGGSVVEEPMDQPWGERVGHVLDPDGNRVIVGQHLDAPSATNRP